MTLQLEHVSRTYRSSQTTVRAVDDVSLSVSKGEFLAVQGPSGCGKSTLLLMAGGLLRPDSGQVLIDEQSPYALPPDQRAEFRARSVGFVFQQFHLIPYLSVIDNILAPALAGRGDPVQMRERASQLLERFGLGPRREHVPAKLSSGERQRVALARALLNEPTLILADEPTGNLDHQNADEVLGYLSEFAANGGSVLLVTHDDRAVAHAHGVVRMESGKVVDQSVATSVGDGKNS